LVPIRPVTPFMITPTLVRGIVEAAGRTSTRDAVESSPGGPGRRLISPLRVSRSGQRCQVSAAKS